MRIAVAGIGYVGLVTAVCLAEKGHEVICVDVDEHRIGLLKNCHSPIYEQDVEELLHRNINRLTFTTDHRFAYRNAEVIFIGVGTPEKKDGSANLTYVYAVARQIAESVESDCVVVLKSTVPIGTNDKVEKVLYENKRNNVEIEVVSNPEFLSQGTAVRDTLQPSRIIIGAESERAVKIMREIYDGFDCPLIVISRRSAEMVKYASNDFLALKISYINEIANLCELVGANVEHVSQGMGLDPRIGGKFLSAGIGYGGSCFPKDTKALHWLASLNDYELKTIKAAIEVNEQQKLKLLKKARKYYETFDGINVAVLGLTFKPGTDDLREAASLINIPILLEEGAHVKAYDPIGIAKFQNALDNGDRDFRGTIGYSENIDDAIRDADICFVLTEWEEIRNYNLGNFSKLMRTAIVLDGRNCIDIQNIRDLNIIYEGIGRGSAHDIYMMPRLYMCSLSGNQ